MLSNPYFHPKILSTFKNYSFSHFFQDVMAGIIVVVVALPLAIAFGIASGVGPQEGIITAIVAGFIISFLGGSRVQIGGPSGSFIVIVYGVIQQHSVSGLLLATMIAGFILIGMGLLKMGSWIKLIPSPIITGFTSGIAVVIFSSQIKDFFGLPITQVPSDFLLQWQLYFKNVTVVSFDSLRISLSTVILIIGLGRFLKKIPAPFVAIVVTSFVVWYFNMDVPTIGGRFGELHGVIPSVEFPPFDIDLIRKLLPSAFAMAMLVAIESLLSAVVSDAMIGGKHRSNTELIAQGVANVVTPLFGGIPATGALARTATNVRSGGRSPVAGIVNALSLMVIFLFAGKFASYIPMASLAGILVVVSYNMCEWREFKAHLNPFTHDSAVLILTFLLTVIFDLTLAIEIGLVFSSFLFVKRMSENTKVIRFNRPHSNDFDTYFDRPDSLENLEFPDNVAVLEIEGSFFFGAAPKLEAMLRDFSMNKQVVILRLNKLVSIDATGVKTLKKIFKEFSASNCSLYLSECPVSISTYLYKSELGPFIKDHNITLGLKNFLNKI